ncbi:MAG: hypothetical protein Tp156SUR915002_15 [Prokaryotic dsDNA virus sp.]|nr:MAG: hypothetical protein Tp162SUR384061_24 [Prokaryotic dsDNA virus sp.]QDP59754.1 MAG: hypothetical protein Tp156SUR915002_15 [Prokaryotic dsDNA virus sp.]|tara:strand:- start:23197 stop:23979 length:783 start_codon:yes stop_codon:yes gene_type:complete
MKIAILGNGICGSSAKKIALEYGHEPTIISSNSNSASKSALASIRPSWFNKAERVSIDRSWAWYKQWNATITKIATVSNWKDPTKTKEQEDWWLVKPISVLEDPDIVGIVPYLDMLKNDYDAILNATGVSLRKDLKHFYGATLVSKKAKANFMPFRIHHIRPYHSVHIVESDGLIRIGSSISKNKEKCVEEIYKMKELCEDLKLVSKVYDWELNMGIRTQTEDKKPITPQLGNPYTSIGGLHRTGYALAPDLIAQWINSL